MSLDINVTRLTRIGNRGLSAKTEVSFAAALGKVSGSNSEASHCPGQQVSIPFPSYFASTLRERRNTLPPFNIPSIHDLSHVLRRLAVRNSVYLAHHTLCAHRTHVFRWYLLTWFCVECALGNVPSACLNSSTSSPLPPSYLHNAQHRADTHHTLRNPFSRCLSTHDSMWHLKRRFFIL